jgi:hypothetical protein
LSVRLKEDKPGEKRGSTTIWSGSDFIGNIVIISHSLLLKLLKGYRIDVAMRIGELT